MTSKIVSRDELKIIGIEVRTNNNDEMSGKGKISEQWQKFYQEELATKIQDKVHSNAILAIYTNYESDFNGEYSFIIGFEVSTFDNVPKGMITKVIPASKYVVLTSEKGPFADVVVGVWKYIWTSKAAEIGGDRAYLADFEVYDERSQDPKNAQVDIFLSIK